MATLTTKYSVGDTVYYAGTVTERKRHACPDCNGSSKWKAVSPAGGEYEFACPRCSASYSGDRDLGIDYSAYVPSVTKRTIGSIQVNTAPGAWDCGTRYMCRETGVGSGNVYDEKILFPTEEEATAAAQAMADEQNTTTEWIVKLYDKSLYISDYQLYSAKIKLAKDETHRAKSMIFNIGSLFACIEEAEDKDAILEAVNDYKNYDWERDKAKASPASPERSHGLTPVAAE